MIWISATSVSVNPIDSVYLGCGNRHKVHPEKIVDTLEASILVAYSLDKVNKIVIISVDTLFLGPKVSQEIITGLSGVFGCSEIFLAASHTHSAPMVDETKPLLGKRNDDYAKLLVSKIVSETLSLASEPPTLSNLSFWRANLGGIVSRRNLRRFSISRKGIRRNLVLQRPATRQYHQKIYSTVAEFRDVDGVLVAAIAVVPCHPVAYQGTNVISADVVGGIRNELRNQFMEERAVPFVLLQGASGDLNPWTRPKWSNQSFLALLDQLINGLRFPLFSTSDLAVWSSLRVKEILSAKLEFNEQAGTLKLGMVRSSIRKVALSQILEAAHDLESRFFHVQKLELENLKLVGVSAEVTWEFNEQVFKDLNNVALVGCIRDSFGYITSSQQYLQGGYEVDGHQYPFSIKHFLNQSPGKIVAQFVNP